MGLIEIEMPPMGESIFECKVLKWLVKEGDTIEEDDMIVEVATDKIDTEIGSSHRGILEKILIQEGETAIIGNPICLLRTSEEDGNFQINKESNKDKVAERTVLELETEVERLISQKITEKDTQKSKNFYSPLILNIAKEEGISLATLNSITGTGKENRLTKNDLFDFLKNRNQVQDNKVINQVAKEDEVITMDRMRKMISERMIASKNIAAHVTSFVEVDMTEIVLWRNKIKEDYFKSTGEKITYTPILIDAIVRAIQKFPMINIQVDDDKIIKKKDINIGMAVALENGNLIVPVIKNTDSFSLVGLTKKVNDLAKRARNNQLKSEELTGGTYTISNIGTFGNLFGTPIIMQPQVAIMAFGVIKKEPSIIETPQGDMIGVRHKMIISHSYDHRVVDGSLGGMFAKQVAENLESIDLQLISF